MSLVQVARLGGPARLRNPRVYPGHHQAAGAGGVPGEFTNHADQVSVITRSQTSRHFFRGKPVTGDRPLKQFHRHGMPSLLRRRLPVSFVDYPRGAFAEFFTQFNISPLQAGHGRTRGVRRRRNRIAAKRQPG